VPPGKIVPVLGLVKQMVDRKSRRIQEMFGAIAHRYDFLNHTLSLSMDRYWRWFARRKIAPLLGPGARVLDLCTGTGDLAFEFATAFPVIGCDFCHPMLVKAREKREGLKDRYPVSFVEGDSLELPFPSGCFEGVTVAFGLRNLEDYERGIREMWRVVRPGGVVGILEFSRPTLPVFRSFYAYYFRKILPWIGNLVSGVSGPYTYLPESVGEFPGPERLEELLRSCGFDRVRHFKLTGGVAVLHLGTKREPPGPTPSSGP